MSLLSGKKVMATKLINIVNRNGKGMSEIGWNENDVKHRTRLCSCCTKAKAKNFQVDLCCCDDITVLPFAGLVNFSLSLKHSDQVRSLG